MNKKLLLSLGTISAVVAPIATVISCGDDSKDTTGTGGTPAAGGTRVTVGKFEFEGKTYKTLEEAQAAVETKYEKHTEGYTVAGTDQIFTTKQEALDYLFGKIKTDVFLYNASQFGDRGFVPGTKTDTTTNTELAAPSRFLDTSWNNFTGGKPIYTYTINPDGDTKYITFKNKEDTAEFMKHEFNKWLLVNEQPRGWEKHKTDPDLSNLFIPGQAHIWADLPVWDSIYDMGSTHIKAEVDLPESTMLQMHEGQLPTKQDVINNLVWVKKGVNGLPASTTGLLNGYSKTTFTIPNVGHVFTNGYWDKEGEITEDIPFTVYKKDGTSLDFYNDLEFSTSWAGPSYGQFIVKAKDPENVKIQYTITEKGISQFKMTREPSIAARITGIDAWHRTFDKNYNSTRPFEDLSELNIHQETSVGVVEESRKTMYQLAYNDPKSHQKIELPNMITQINFVNGHESTEVPQTYKEEDQMLADNPLVGKATFVNSVGSSWSEHPWESISKADILKDFEHYTTLSVLNETYVSEADWNAFNAGKGKLVDPSKELHLQLDSVISQADIDGAVARNPREGGSANGGKQGYYLEGLYEEAGIFSSIEALKNYFRNGEPGSAEELEDIRLGDTDTWGKAAASGIVRKIIKHFSGVEYFINKDTKEQFTSKHKLYNKVISNDGQVIDSFALEHAKVEEINYSPKDMNTSFDLKSDITTFLGSVTSSTEFGKFEVGASPADKASRKWEDGLTNSIQSVMNNRDANSTKTTIYESTKNSKFKIEGINVEFATRKDAEDFLWNTEQAFKLKTGFFSQADFDARPLNSGYIGDGTKFGEEVPFRTLGQANAIRDWDGMIFTGLENHRKEILGLDHEQIYIVKQGNVLNWRVYKSEIAAQNAIKEGHGAEFERLSVSKATYEQIKNEDLYLNAYDAITAADEALTTPAGMIKMFVDPTTGFAFKSRELFKKWFILKDLIMDHKITETGWDTTKPLFNIYTPTLQDIKDHDFTPTLYRNRNQSGWTIDKA